MDSGEEVVVVRAEMQPLVLETMTKFDENEQVCHNFLRVAVTPSSVRRSRLRTLLSMSARKLENSCSLIIHINFVDQKHLLFTTMQTQFESICSETAKQWKHWKQYKFTCFVLCRVVVLLYIGGCKINITIGS